MPQLNDPFTAPRWDSVDTENLRAFLQSPTGKRFIHRLRNERPTVDTTTVEKAALSGAEVSGFEMAVTEIFELVVSTAADNERSDLYAALDRDELWGPDLQPENFRIEGKIAVPMPPPAPVTPK